MQLLNLLIKDANLIIFNIKIHEGILLITIDIFSYINSSFFNILAIKKEFRFSIRENLLFVYPLVWVRNKKVLS